MRYVYPAVFTPEDNGYSVVFPDLEGCYTCGDSMEDAMYMASDVLAFTLYGLEKDGFSIPEPSSNDEIKLGEGEFSNYIFCDTIEYQKKYNTKAVKKTLSIPEWLNEAAMKAGLNFSQILQEGLRRHLNL